MRVSLLSSVPALFRRRVVTVLLFAALTIAAAPAGASDRVGSHLSEILAGPGQEFPGFHVRAHWSYLRDFYEGRRYQPVWVDDNGPIPKARDLVRALSEAYRDGLIPDAYGAAALSALAEGRMPAGLAAMELLLSAEFLNFAGDLQRGRVAPAGIDLELFVVPDDFDPAAVLSGVAGTSDIPAFLAGFAPANTPYRRLRLALERYRGIEARGGWPRVPDGPALRPGTRDPGVAVLRARLVASGDLDGGPAGGYGIADELYDPALERAVIAFQDRFGLDTDGVVGPRTRAQLNVPVGERIRQIEINMERWRWMPDELGRRHIRVNLAGFELDLIDGGEVELNMRVVVGRNYRRTPVFSDRMTYMELNPTWTVTPSIARNDLIPRIRENPAYLADNGFRVYAGWSREAPEIVPSDVDWNMVDPRRMPYRFVQAPGPLNALGQIKFMFPNRFNVYLHDTPSRELFRKTVRAFSSGCIRVEQPLELARSLLADQREWTRERLVAAIGSGATRVVRLAQPVPIHIMYATAWVDEDGIVHFRDDIYGRDALLRKALYDVQSSPGQTGIVPRR